MIFIDTNYFLRFLLKDIKKQYQEAKNLFLKGAEGEVKLFTSIIAIFEIYWVPSSFYQKKKDEIIDIIEKIFQLVFIKIDNKNVLREGIEIYKKTNLEFEDCYNLALARKKEIKEFKTFDKKLEKYFLKITS